MARGRPAAGGGRAAFLDSLPDDSPFFETDPRATFPNAEFGNRKDVLMADIPAQGKMSARAMARKYVALLGEVDGVRLISPERLREVSAPAFGGEDQVTGSPFTWALGYEFGRRGTDVQETQTVFGHGGAGGGYAYADTATGVAFALMKNRLAPDFGAAEQVSGIVANIVADG